jgi:hypothetical protein
MPSGPCPEGPDGDSAVQALAAGLKRYKSLKGPAAGVEGRSLRGGAVSRGGRQRARGERR